MGERSRRRFNHILKLFELFLVAERKKHSICRRNQSGWRRRWRWIGSCNWCVVYRLPSKRQEDGSVFLKHKPREQDDVVVRQDHRSTNRINRIHKKEDVWDEQEKQKEEDLVTSLQRSYSMTHFKKVIFQGESERRKNVGTFQLPIVEIKKMFLLEVRRLCLKSSHEYSLKKNERWWRRTSKQLNLKIISKKNQIYTNWKANIG